MKMAQSPLAAWRDRAVAGVAAIVAGALALLSAGSAASSTLARPSRALYYETALGPGTFAIDKLNLSAPMVSVQVVMLRSADAFGIALGGPYMYWSTQRGPRDRGAIMRASLNSGHVRRVVGGLTSNGLAVTGTHIYWTQLGSGTIGRAMLNGRDVDGRWLNIHSRQGPFQVVADRTDVYWTWGGVDDSPSYTGRADANRSHLDRRFLAESLYPMALSDAEPNRP